MGSPDDVRRASRSLLLLAVLAAWCATAPPLPAPPPAEVDAGELVLPVPRFAALYRLRCCGHGSLLAAVRWDGSALATSVTAPPGAVVLEGYFPAGGAGWVREAGESCRKAVAGVRVGALGVPLVPAAVAAVLAGRVDPSYRPRRSSPSRLLATVGETALFFEASGSPARCVEVGIPSGDAPDSLRIFLSEHRGMVPGRVELAAGRESATLSLVEWRSLEAALAEPGWFAFPACEVSP